MYILKTAFVCLVVFYTEIIICGSTSVLNPKIIGGIDAPENFAPYQVSLLEKPTTHFCSGAIIHKRYIVTAGHCVVGINYSTIQAVAGIQDLSEEGQHYDFKRILLHHNFVQQLFMNDIALLETVVDIEFNHNVKPIAIHNSYPPLDAEVISTGWGLTEDETVPEILRMIKVKVFNWSDCFEMMRKIDKQIFTNQICTYTKVGEGTCFGDSGGPLVYKGELVGLVSWGVPCAMGYPDVFTGILDQKTWIYSFVPLEEN